MTREETLERFAAIFADLSEDGIGKLAPLLTDDVRFVDPFQEVHGRDAYLAVYDRMFETLREPSFAIDDIAFGEDGYIRWTMRFRFVRSPRVWHLVGMSQFVFAEDGRIAEHIDHWDAGAQVYARIPGLGFLIERIRRRVAHER